jgi:hypothetical protein
MIEMLKAASLLRQLLYDSENENRINIKFKLDYSCGSVCAEIDDLTIYSPAKFAEIIKKADNFEIYPLISGKIRFSMMFHNLYIGIA